MKFRNTFFLHSLAVDIGMTTCCSVYLWAVAASRTGKVYRGLEIRVWMPRYRNGLPLDGRDEGRRGVGLFVRARTHPGLCSPCDGGRRFDPRLSGLLPCCGRRGRGCYRRTKGEVDPTLGQRTKVESCSTHTLPTLGRCVVVKSSKSGLAVFHQRSILGCKVG